MYTSMIGWLPYCCAESSSNDYCVGETTGYICVLAVLLICVMSHCYICTMCALLFRSCNAIVHKIRIVSHSPLSGHFTCRMHEYSYCVNRNRPICTVLRHVTLIFIFIWQWLVPAYTMALCHRAKDALLPPLSRSFAIWQLYGQLLTLLVKRYVVFMCLLIGICALNERP